MASPKVRDIVSGGPVVVVFRLGAKFKVVELDQEGDGVAVQAALQEMSGKGTVPNVFIGGKHIGGCDDTIAMHENGKFVPLLSEAGGITSAA